MFYKEDLETLKKSLIKRKYNENICFQIFIAKADDICNLYRANNLSNLGAIC